MGVSLGGYYAPRTAAFEPRVKAAVAIGGPHTFGALWDELPSLTRETFVHHSGAAGPEEGRRLALELSLDGVLPKVAQPLLVIAGRQDRLIPPEQAERVAAEAPNAELVMYADGNHVQQHPVQVPAARRRLDLGAPARCGLGSRRPR